MNNLDMMRKRLEYQGGIQQEARMIQDKYRSFLKSLQYSYQGCDVQLAQKFSSIEPISEAPQYRALINPDKLKQDYDDKILSIDYKSGFEPGDVFCWLGTNTHWLVYLQALTEDAYFRGEIRRCKYKIKFKDKNNNKVSTWAYIRGPVETTINSIQKHQIQIDVPNLTLSILMPKNEITLQAFDRYAKFLFEGKCWQVETIDTISTINVIEITAQENYINEDADDTQNEIANGLIVEPADPNPIENLIEGETFIKPKLTYTYVYNGEDSANWRIEDKIPVKLEVNSDLSVNIIWDATISGQFDLYCNNEKKTIVVESLF